jgi:hypothetical protein
MPIGLDALKALLDVLMAHKCRLVDAHYSNFGGAPFPSGIRRSALIALKNTECLTQSNSQDPGHSGAEAETRKA